jgi:hypothetical protein
MSYGDTPSNTSSTTTSSPWKGVQPYLTGGKLADGTVIKGIYPQVNDFAQQYGSLTPEEQSLADSYSQQLQGRGDLINQNYQDSNYLTGQIQNGSYNSNFSPVDNSSLPDNSIYNQAKAAQTSAYFPETASQSSSYKDAAAAQSSPYQNASATNAIAAQAAPNTFSDIVQGRTSQGTLDPTQALSNLLNGSVDNPYLKAMNQTNIDQATQGYNAQIQNLMQAVMPGINNDAFASGQYGGSRQGIAQGLALQQQEINAANNQQKALDSGNTLYGNAYEAAQNRMATAAGDLNNQGTQNQQFNATNANQNSQFNAGLSQQANLANAQAANSMAQLNANNSLQNNQFNASNTQQANLANAANNLQNNQFNTSQDNNMAQFNAGNTLQNSQYNAGLRQQTNLANASNQLNNNQFNTANALNNNQFNANLGLQNNTQQMAKDQQNLNTQITGNNLANQSLSSLLAGQDQTYNQQTQMAQLPMNRTLDMLNMQLGAYMPGANIGGSSTAVTPYYSNTLGQLGGAATTGAGIYGLLNKP